MKSRWIADYATGEAICAVCGAKKGNRKTCCPTNPNPGTFEEFKRAYFGEDEEKVPHAIAREFYSEFRLYPGTLEEYIAETTEAV